MSRSHDSDDEKKKPKDNSREFFLDQAALKSAKATRDAPHYPTKEADESLLLPRQLPKPKAPSLWSRIKNYAKKHPFRFALFAGAAVIGIAAFIAGCVLTGGALAGATAGGIAGILLSGTGAVGGTLIASGGIVAALGIGAFNHNMRQTDLEMQEKKLAQQSMKAQTGIRQPAASKPAVKTKVIAVEKVKKIDVSEINWKKELKKAMTREDVGKFMGAYDKVKLNKVPVENRKVMDQYHSSVSTFVQEQKSLMANVKDKHKNDDFYQYKNYIDKLEEILQKNPPKDQPHASYHL